MLFRIRDDLIPLKSGFLCVVAGLEIGDLLAQQVDSLLGLSELRFSSAPLRPNKEKDNPCDQEQQCRECHSVSSADPKAVLNALSPERMRGP
ncbi:hypothetical protein MEBOL_000840 [Melittangium boletus DSM 14713]|uniref:Uncharacterized protein n=1 Tax=Melittangium boletus DSM 14713 TaxID=1294270 RepID=A0A250I872_9BACT|nr:hypothetical protein MEBOL_000840 [Melittangium boletus DSM 14713]